MNNINLNSGKKIISGVVLLVVVLLFAGAVYYVNHKVRSYKADVLGDYTKLAELENEKKVLDTYNKILLKGSKESQEIKKHIVSGDRKDVLHLINELETYIKKVGLSEGNISPILSVATRENAAITKFQAKDLVISIKVVGSEKNIDEFISLLRNLPVVSFVEKIDMKFDPTTNKNSATFTLVLYQKNEVK